LDPLASPWHGETGTSRLAWAAPLEALTVFLRSWLAAVTVPRLPVTGAVP